MSLIPRSREHQRRGMKGLWEQKDRGNITWKMHDLCSDEHGSCDIMEKEGRIEKRKGWREGRKDEEGLPEKKGMGVGGEAGHSALYKL